MQHGYLELKLAWQLFEKSPETLSESEKTRLLEVAKKQCVIEQRILASAEAGHVAIPAATLFTRLHEIRKRYPNENEFVDDLARINLLESELEQAVERDLRIEAVLEKIASGAEPVSAVDAEIYYHLQPKSFNRPESRRLRHILITSDNPTQKKRNRTLLETLRTSLQDIEAFSAAALRHSQCPTAVSGGLLGVVTRKKLFPELEPAAFELKAGEISPVLESPVGLHILRCDEILPSGMLPFAEVQERIIAHLLEIRRKKMQREWIKHLPETGLPRLKAKARG